MLKTAVFLAAFIPGISAAALSVESQKSLRADLYWLKEVENLGKDRRNRPSQRRSFADHLKQILLDTEEGEDEEGREDEEDEEGRDEEEDEEGRDEGGISYRARYSKQRNVFNPENSSVVKSFFQNDESLLQWIKDSPELIYNAIQFGNLELVQFFVENGSSINAARETTHFSPLHFAIISFHPDIIRWFLDHPQTNLRQTSVWGENLFHFVFLTGNQGKRQNRSVAQNRKSEKMQILDILFQPEYFVKISDLLNVPNHYNETVLDFARREGTGSNEKQIVSFLRRKGALSYEDLEKSRRSPPQTPEESRPSLPQTKPEKPVDRCFESFQGNPDNSVPSQRLWDDHFS